MNPHEDGNGRSVLQTHGTLLSRLLGRADLARLTVHDGQFHKVVVGPDRVLCLPRTEAAAVRLPRRAAMLKLVADIDLGVRTPVALELSEANEGGGTPYLVMNRVPGQPLPAAALTHDKCTNVVATQLARVLIRLADAGLDARVREALPVAPDRWQRFARDARAALFKFMSPDGRRRAETELRAVEELPHRATAVVHGDLGGENILWTMVDGLPQLSGVIDWDTVTLGDPAEDLAAISVAYGEGVLNRLLLARPSTDAETPARITAVRRTFALQQALAACEDGDEEEMADGLNDYRRQRL